MRCHGLAAIALAASTAAGLTTARVAGANRTAWCTDSSRTCVIAAATTYLDALISHDATGVRLAPAAIRTENGIDTGDSATDIRGQLTTGIQYKVITGIRDVRWFVDGEDAIAFYLLDTSTYPPTVVHTATAHISEHFHVTGGLITSIEAIDCAAAGLTPEGERKQAVQRVVMSLCFRAGG